MKLFHGFLMALLASSTAIADGPSAAEIEAGKGKIVDYLKSINGAQARMTPIADDSLGKLFPKHFFMAVLYPQFPIGREAPKPLREANVLVAPVGEGKVIPLTEAKELEKFFKDTLPAKAEGEMVGKAWVRLAQEIVTDGFYQFKAPTAAKGSKEGIFSAKVEVNPAGGNKGHLEGEIELKDGKLVRAVLTSKLIPGPRPICQSTKLLDPDPIVRRMAEDSIRIMGRACFPYLDEQRAKSTPDLQKAIDRMKQRILDEDR